MKPLLTYLEKFGLKRSAPRQVQWMHPTRDWLLGLLVGSILFIGGGVYSGVLFLNATRLADEGFVADPSPLMTYRHADVQRVIETYEKNAEAFYALHSVQAPVVEVPSTEVSDLSASTTDEGATDPGALVAE